MFSDEVYTHSWQSGQYPYSITVRAEYPCLGVLLASRQIHHETALLPYKLATFVLDSEYEWAPLEAEEFLAKRSEAQLAALGRIEVMCCEKTWHGTGCEFSEVLDYINSTDCMDNWLDSFLCR